MGKTAKPKGNKKGAKTVTPDQVALIVDRYLADNNYDLTRSSFRSEASNLLSKFDPLQVPKTLLSLGEMLEEYIKLKEQKMILEQEKYNVEQEKYNVEQEKLRVQTLLQGMQDAMNGYNSGAACLAPSPSPPPTLPPALGPSTSGYPAFRTPGMTSLSMSHSVKLDHTNFSSPITSSKPPRKRRVYNNVYVAPMAPKRICAPLPSNQGPLIGATSIGQSNNAPMEAQADHQSSQPQTLSPEFAKGGSPIQGSNVAKSLFNRPSQSPNSNSSVPKTPPRAVSSQSDKSISPLEEVSSTGKSHQNDTPPDSTPTNCTIFASKTIIVSPTKHLSIERSHCTLSSPAKGNFKWQSKRDHVKGRLDFDDGCEMPTSLETTSGDGSGCSTSESEKEGDIFDLDLAKFDHAFGPDFSLSELLTDFGIDCGTLDYACPTTSGVSPDTAPMTQSELNNVDSGKGHDMVQHSSAITETFAGEMSQNGRESITSVKSITKRITIVSPSKSSHNSFVQDQVNKSM